jgi:hypothetical protein
MKNKYVPMEKRSKKAQKEANRERRACVGAKCCTIAHGGELKYNRKAQKKADRTIIAEG